jgi:hypothetical protein
VISKRTVKNYERENEQTAINGGESVLAGITFSTFAEKVTHSVYSGAWIAKSARNVPPNFLPELKFTRITVMCDRHIQTILLVGW